MVLHVTDRVKMVNPNDINNIVFNSVCWATIPEVTVQDSGMYYCVLSHGQFAYVGNGTRLTVTGGKCKCKDLFFTKLFLTVCDSATIGVIPS